MLGTRLSRFSRHVGQFFGTCIELELCFSGPKSTLPSLRHRARFQGKVFRYPEAEDSDYRQQQQSNVKMHFVLPLVVTVSLSTRSYIACVIDFGDVYLPCIKSFMICYYLFSIKEEEHATFVIGLYAPYDSF